ncbi:inositol monophosphatase family protein [Carboxylicivirga linearis]|uniref:Inositol-1-monophosphatase n=1 Tax=Carboxylicivirga linearis TaxID=1628157 RepID=A0ABS5JXZ4_9BACT|nr:inositol monophosphatase family protein [Carboxylicivirga linearis]MBS2099768.1 inositol monophosphatase [Carboxylicivirga linearis]
MNYKNICESVCEIARSTGLFIKEERQNAILNIETKGSNDFVTHIDKASERRIVDGLKKLLPEAGFIAEEGTEDVRGDKFNWIIDPIDGTTNFIHGLSPYAVSIALMEDDKMVVGVVYEVGLDECFYSWKGGQAYLNGKVIEVSKAPTVADSLVATGFPYSNFSRMDGFKESLDYFMMNSHGLRRLGSAATDLVYVACGRFESFYEYDLKPWDVAAGAFIVEQAGGKVCDFSKGDNYIFGREIIASNKATFDEFSNAIYKLMVK